jgi:hypothetical protein
VIAQRKLLGISAIADGITDAKNVSVDGPLRVCAGFLLCKSQDHTTIITTVNMTSQDKSMINLIVGQETVHGIAYEIECVQGL